MGTIKICKKNLILTKNFLKNSKYVYNEKQDRKYSNPKARNALVTQDKKNLPLGG